MNAPNPLPTPPGKDYSCGRAYFWAGIGACLLGLGLFFVQFALKYLFVPWYSPVLASVGAGLLLAAVTGRRSIPRLTALLVVTALAALQWYFLVSMMKLPDYTGPAQAGKQLPAFNASP
jgi:hypothetical protein